MLSRAIRTSTSGAQRRFASALTVKAPTYNPVKIQHEDIAAVMEEVPDFQFYHIGGTLKENPYKNVTLDQSIIARPAADVAPSAPKYEFSQLENGLRVATANLGGADAQLGLFVHAGSRFSNASNLGVVDMISQMSYHSTAHLSHLRTIKTLEHLGVEAKCNAGRDFFSYQATTLPEHLPFVVPILIGNILFPRFLRWEVKAEVEDALERKWSEPEIVEGMLHAAAFTNNTLGLKLQANAASCKNFVGDTMRDFMMQNCSPKNCVVVGVNVDHAELTKWTMRSYAEYNAIPHTERKPVAPTYYGGDSRMEAPTGSTTVVLAVPTSGWNGSDNLAAAVASAHIGGGSLAKSTTIMQQPGVYSADPYSVTHSDAGLFGMSLSCSPDAAAAAIKGAADALKSVGKMSAEELARAKAVARSTVLASLEDSSSLLENMGAQMMFGDGFATPIEIAAAIDGVTAADMTSFASKALGNKPTLASYGAIEGVPHFDQVAAMLK
jgi:processing peptidase subunit alpha